MQSKITRRDFLRGSAAGVVGAALSGVFFGIPVLALEDGQADEYTQAVLDSTSSESVGDGTVYPSGTFSVNTDYTDETFEYTAVLEETTFPDVYPTDNMTPMTGEELDTVIAALVSSMTYDEKINMLSMNTDPEDRSGVGYMTGIPRLGVPESRMHDGPAGISTSGDSYVETTNPPIQLTASMTWSEDLIYEYGKILGTEHASTGSGWQLGTQMDLARTPHWARAKDTFGEDYYLTGQMTMAETRGVQENGGIAMAKHIGAYSTDGDTLLWIEVDEQTLHTAYLYPFEMAAKNADLASIMGTYNRLNGYYVSSNKELQIEILRNMWDWGGAMVPDWGADKEEFSLPLGTTISQSNAATIDAGIRSAASQGSMTMDELNECVSRSLYALGVSGYLNLVELDGNGYVKEEPGRTDPIRFERTYTEDREAGLYDENNQTALELAEKGIVLLKNENAALPLTEEDYTGDQSVALIGYGAVNLVGGTGGERSFGVLEYMTTPYESIVDIVGEDANVTAYGLGNVHGTDIPADYVFHTQQESETVWFR
ncbi:MAG: twin-arginine translocation signal domain-containing protein, partial [Lachnospiraceae bacterium]|nr:twin-arginine translocation signal domain-containing protein [Lachnospiraceae bacterium]